MYLSHFFLMHSLNLMKVKHETKVNQHRVQLEVQLEQLQPSGRSYAAVIVVNSKKQSILRIIKDALPILQCTISNIYNKLNISAIIYQRIIVSHLLKPHKYKFPSSFQSIKTNQTIKKQNQQTIKIKIINYNSKKIIQKNPQMSYQNEIDDEHLMSKLQQIIPELRKQIQSALKNKYEQQLVKAIQNKKKELKKVYEIKVKENIEEKNLEIKVSLNQMIQMIQNYKSQQRNKNRILNKEEETIFIEQTVQEILSNESMLEQVKNRLRPKLEIKVKSTLDRQLQNGIDLVKRQLLQKNQQDKQIWTEQRIQFWKRQSDLQLQELSTQHNELNTKKLNIETSLNTKKMEKVQLQQKLQEIANKNARISSLRSHLKQLKQQIKC